MALVSRGGWVRSRKAGTIMAMHGVIPGLLGHDRVKAARQHIERTDDVTLARQARLSAIPAPTGAEAQRAARVAELFREAGLGDVRIDEAGNVSGWVDGNGGTQKDSLTVGGRGKGLLPSSCPRIWIPCSGPTWTSRSSAGAGGSRGRGSRTTPAASRRSSPWPRPSSWRGSGPRGRFSSRPRWGRRGRGTCGG